MFNDSNGSYPVKLVLDHLCSVGVLTQAGKVDVRRISNLRFGRLIELIEFIADPAELRLERAKSLFVQSASISLGGGSADCEEIGCRLHRARAVGRYAAAVADKVYVHNAFSQYLGAHNHPFFVHDCDEIRLRFTHDLMVFLELAPLIEAGLIVPFPAGDAYCDHCLAQFVFGEASRKRLDAAMFEYRKRFRALTRIAVAAHDYGFTLHLKAPETVLPHGESVVWIDRLPRSLSRLPNLRNEISCGKEVWIPTDVAARLRLCEDYADTILRKLRYGLTTAAFGASYVTDAPAEVQVLADLSDDSDLLNRNKLIARHLTSVIPFLDDLEPSALAKLRESEPESFIAYRKALSEAVSSVANTKPDQFSVRDARAIYGDVIEPELTKLQKHVKEARRRAIRTAVRSAIGWGAALTFGLYTGIVPVELAAAVKSLGLTKVVADVISNAGSIRDAAKSIRQENFYFLWRAKRLKRK